MAGIIPIDIPPIARRKTFLKSMSEFYDKMAAGQYLPPQAIEVEQSLLGAMMQDKQAASRIFETIGARSEDDSPFYRDAHTLIYRAGMNLDVAGEPIDLLSMTNRLRVDGTLEEVGGTVYLVELTQSVVTTANVEAHARILLEKYIARELIRTCEEMKLKAFNGEEDTFEMLDEAEAHLFKLSETRHAKNASNMRDLAKSTMEHLMTIQEHHSGVTGVPSGLLDLDELTGGWQKTDMIILAARPSQGKAQPLDAKVLTPSGFKTMGSLAVGDKVIGRNGKACNVVGIYPQGTKDVYRVTFADGRSTECTDDHLWLTTTKTEQAKKTSSVKSLSAIRATLRHGDRLRHEVPICEPVKFQKGKNLLLHPYLLGVYLGDGSYSNTIRLTNQEKDIVQKFTSHLPDADTMHDRQGTGLDHRVLRKVRAFSEPSETKKLLEHYGLDNRDSYSKFIPSDYLFAEVESRIQLLQGLLDADGHCTNIGGRRVELTTSSQQLADGVQFLVRSLGGTVTCSSRIPTYHYKGEKKNGARSYRMHIGFFNDVVPVSSEKHLARFSSTGKKICRQFIQSVELVGKKECQCIEVDAKDGLYVTDDFIVTHNTALALTLARSAALHPEKDKRTAVAIFSLEMGAQQLTLRMLCSEAKVNMQQARKGRLSQEDLNKVVAAIDRLQNAPIFIDDTAGITPLELRAKCRRLKQTEKIGLVIVDYLQLMEPGRKLDSREREISFISRQLKALAKELNVPVIALSQLNRGVETRSATDKRPMLSDLRESGAIEQDADLVLFIYRPETYGIEQWDDDQSPTRDTAEVIVGKQRNGPIGHVKTLFKTDTGRFENLDRNLYGY